MAKDNCSLLESLVENDSVLIGVEASDWKDAVRKCTKPLLKSQAIEPRYTEAIIDSTVKNGPYYIIDEDVAMPHSRPEDGVNKNAFSLVVLKKPVKFPNDEREISILISLAAVSSDIHVGQALPQIVSVFESPETKNQILSAKTKQEVIDIISRVDFTKYL